MIDPIVKIRNRWIDMRAVVSVSYVHQGGCMPADRWAYLYAHMLDKPITILLGQAYTESDEVKMQAEFDAIVEQWKRVRGP